MISGGGAGHEPAHAGYTGRGMLTASVSGDIFASPSTKQILTAIHLAAFSSSKEPRDVLVIINNYSGDRLNFGLAIEKARAEGLNIESVIVADDVSLIGSSSEPSLVGPRGLAGNILVCKALGALAEQGADLQLLKAFGDAVVASLASIGAVLEPCHIPGREKDELSNFASDRIGLGCGLHNEPAAKKYSLASADSLVTDMLNLISESKDPAFAKEGNEIVLFANNLGGISQLEMAAILDETLTRLGQMKIQPVRVYSSPYMTSLNAPGFSISLLNATSVPRSLQNDTKTTLSVDICQLLDDPTDATGWLGASFHWPKHGSRDLEQELQETEQFVATFNSGQSTSSKKQTDFWRQADISPQAVKNGLVAACTAVQAAESEITRCDTVLGDGDCGTTLKGGASAIKQAIQSGTLEVERLDPSGIAERFAEVLQDVMGGTMGALLGILLTALARSLRDATSSTDIPKALDKALTDLARHTPAKPGDRTMVDTLRPFCDILKDGQGIQAALEGARRGTEATKNMKPRLGRSVYVGIMSDDERLPPDPGALGMLTILEGYISGYTS